MINRITARFLLLVLGSLSVFSARVAIAQETLPALRPAATNKVFHPLSPGPVDGQIALVSAKILERYHYLRQPFNDAVSSKFLDRYLETLDPQHLHFLQSDLASFEHYRTNLDRLTVPERGPADTRPGCEIFNRFVQRLEQRVAYADELLKNDTFTFDTDERIAINRKDLPYPKDITEARRLWRERLRFEYLQEKLGKVDAKKKAAKAGSTETNAPAVQTKPKTEREEIVDTLSHRYHRNLRTFVDWDSDDVLQIYLTTLAHVYDPHSDYFGHAQLDSFTIGMNLSLCGIGAELMSEDGYCKINRLLPGGPAVKSGKLKEKDRIIAVAQSNQPPVDVVDMSLNKAVQLIRGPKGTEVRLTIIPAVGNGATRKELTLIRDEIPLEDQAAKARLLELPGENGEPLRLGFIDLPSFYAPFDPSNTRDKNGPKSTTSEDVALLLKKLKQENVKGIILDLRRNGGGSLEEAIKLTGLFIKKGPVVLVRDFDGTVQEDDDKDPSLAYDGPLIVLTSRFSASASEIVAGALQDYGRALVVGDSSTHGKGTVQSVQTLKPFIRAREDVLTNDPGALKLTIKKFYRASGSSTQLRGVVPDIVLPSIFNESKEIGENALENPLPYDTIDSAAYERLNRVEPYLPELKKRSADRMATDKDYAYIREDIELYRKQQEDKTISLNEKQRLKEKEENEARQKARDKERLARKDPQEKVYDLSLKLAAQPGLPPPVAKTNTLAKASMSKHPGFSGTNIALSGPEGLSDANLDDDPDEEKPPAVDPALTEAKHILADYVSLMPKGAIVQATRNVGDPR